MMDTQRIWFLAGAVVLAVWASGQAGEVKLAGRYIDPVHGFSLRPPAGAISKREFSVSRLVSWSKRDPGTGAIAWTLSVHRVIEGHKDIDLKQYSKALAEKLARQEKFKVDSVKLSPAGGKGAIHLRGISGGRVKLWQRQVWILARPQQFLIIMISGPVDMKARLDDICQAVLETLKLTDPKTAAALREKMLARGRKLLAGLTDEKLAAAIRTKPQWLLLRLENKYVGFMKVAESRAEREATAGYEVKTWVWAQVRAKAPPTLGKLVAFATADRTREYWSKNAWVGAGQGRLRKVLGEEVTTHRNSISSKVTSNEPRPRTQARKTTIPPGNIPVYLPQAMVMLLPRLVDLKAKGTYAFAVYNAQADGFDMRTFSVAGAEQIALGGKKINAIRCTDQPAADVPAVTLWVDPDGALLRTVNTVGLVMEAATRDDVLKHFARAPGIIAAMGK